MKRIVTLLAGVSILFALVSCGGKNKAEKTELSEVQKIVKQAQGMSMEELAKKAIEESNGKRFYGVTGRTFF